MEKTSKRNGKVGFVFWIHFHILIPKILFHNVSVVKMTNVYYRGNLGIELLYS